MLLLHGILKGDHISVEGDGAMVYEGI
jgi:hypothetical protein